MIQRVKDITFRGKKIRLCMTMDVLLNIQEEYNCSLSNMFSGTDRENFDREIYILMALSYEGKAVTDYENDIETFSAQDFENLQPFEREELSTAMWAAIAKGFKKEYEDEEVDETLLEVKKKKTSLLQKAKQLIQRKR